MSAIFSFLWHYLKAEKKSSIMVAIPMLGAFILGPLVPTFYRSFIDLIAAGNASPEVVAHLWSTVRQFVLMIIAVQVCWKTMEWWLVPLESALAKRVYDDAFSHILGQSHRFFSGQPSGSLVRIISRLADTTWQFLDTMIFQVLRFVFNVVVMLIVLWYQNLYLGLAMLIWMVLLITIKGKLWKNNFALNASTSEASTRISGQISDVFTNAFTVLTCGTQLRELRTFHHVVGEWTALQKRTWWQEYRIFLTTTAFILTLQICSLSGLVYLWSSGAITAGTATMVLVYMTLFIDHAVEINFVFRNVYRQSSDMKEAIDLLGKDNEIQDASDASRLALSGGEIVFDRVSFSYHEEGEDVLKDFSLTIRPGEKVALIGLSGSGKSTVMKLLFRLYDVTSGSIRIDGQDIASVTQDSLRQSMSMVPQDPTLFHRSIADNIAYTWEYGEEKRKREKEEKRGESLNGGMVEDEEKRKRTKEEKKEENHRDTQRIQRAARLAHAHDFIAQLPQGYDTLVGERGVKLSGGERQRVTLARAIYAERSIFVMDEATSSLDSESEKMIQESLHEVMQGRTSIVIAHRLSTIMQMDRIVVMSHGKIVEEGTHTELVKKSGGHYKKLWDIQTGEFIRDIGQ